MRIENVGLFDQIVRVTLGPALLALPFILGIPLFSAKGFISLLIGALLTITAFMSHCPIYKLLSFSSTQQSE